MKHFRPGKFDKDEASGILKNWCPDKAVTSLYKVDPQVLWDSGIRLVLLDVDNTLLPWKSEEMPQESIDWVNNGKALGLSYCILSNTRNPERLQRLASMLDVKALTGKFKPSRDMYVEALRMFNYAEDQAVMIGDQLLTDVWGANRSGVHAIWVRRMSNHEFIGTRANRIIERAIGKRLHKIMEEEEDDFPIITKQGIFQHKTVRQIAKFLIVGGSSFVIDAGLHRLLMFNLTAGGTLVSVSAGEWLHQALGSPGIAPDTLAFVAFKIPTASLAILNSFYWNRRWTFGIKTKEDQHKQLMRFVTVSLVGLALNSAIGTVVFELLQGKVQHAWTVATVSAAGAVAVWNFLGQRLWAFRKSA
jgi:HAD superfamily phosphatase (TIGR01668 family)